MKLEIGTNTRIKDVQQKFTEVYPFLKMDFYKRKHAEKELSAMEDMINPEELLTTDDKYTKSNSIDIRKDRTVSALEKEFYERFGVAMQVSRRSGNTWIQTSKTDYRTLEMQNESGKSMSSLHNDLESNTHINN